jgi:hypothetical protein
LAEDVIHPGLPKIRVAEGLEVPDIRKVLLAEFAGAPVREIIERDLSPRPEGTRVSRRIARKKLPRAKEPAAQIVGQRLVRVIHPADGVLAQVDPQSNRLPLDFMAGRADGVVLASARPGNPYSWQLLGLAPLSSPDAMVLTVSGAREATEAEAEALDGLFPEWRERCREFDERLESDLASAGAAAVPPPEMPGPKPDARAASRLRAGVPQLRRARPRPRPV